MMKRILSLFTVLAMLLTCGAVFATATETATVGTATVMGFGGDITVSVKLEDGVITAVEMKAPAKPPASAARSWKSGPVCLWKTTASWTPIRARPSPE